MKKPDPIPELVLTTTTLSNLSSLVSYDLLVKEAVLVLFSLFEPKLKSLDQKDFSCIS